MGIYLAIDNDVYNVEMKIFSNESSKSLNIPGNIGGIASLAGLNLGDAASNNSKIAIEYIKSKTFIYSVIENNLMLEDLYAGYKYDREKDQLIYDENLITSDTKTWKIENGKTKKPNSTELFKFIQSRLNIEETKTSGVYKVTFKHASPIVASKFLSVLIADVNARIKEIERKNINNYLRYLNDESKKQTNIENLKTIISIKQEQLKRSMLLDSKENFVFDTIDPPNSDIKPSGMSSYIIIVLCTFFSFLMYILIVTFLGLKNEIFS